MGARSSKDKTLAYVIKVSKEASMLYSSLDILIRKYDSRVASRPPTNRLYEMYHAYQLRSLKWDISKTYNTLVDLDEEIDEYRNKCSLLVPLDSDLINGYSNDVYSDDLERLAFSLQSRRRAYLEEIDSRGL
jgi:hypothetical protein